MNPSNIEVIEKNIKEAKEIVAKGAALERLYSNKDFKTVISKGYLEQEAIRLVHAKANPGMQTGSLQLDILKQIDAIGALTAYFRGVEHQAFLAAKAIEDDEATREELLQEGNDE